MATALFTVADCTWGCHDSPRCSRRLGRDRSDCIPVPGWYSFIYNFLPNNSYESTSKHILWVCLIVTILLKSGWLSYLHTLRRGCVPGGCLPVVDRAWGCHSDSPQVRPTTERWSPWPPFRLSGVQFLLQYLSNSSISRILNVSDLPMGHLYFASLLCFFYIVSMFSHIALVTCTKSYNKIISKKTNTQYSVSITSLQIVRSIGIEFCFSLMNHGAIMPSM